MAHRCTLSNLDDLIKLIEIWPDFWLPHSNLGLFVSGCALCHLPRQDVDESNPSMREWARTDSKRRLEAYAIQELMQNRRTRSVWLD